MNIKERIDRLGIYFHSMNVSSECSIIYVKVKFPKGWGCSELTEYNFNVKTVNDEMPGFFYFFANIEVGLDKIFDAIEYNIAFNEEALAKVSLLKEKIDELKTIFENEEIDVLKTLEFKYKKKKTKKNKKINNVNNNEHIQEVDNIISENSENEYVIEEQNDIIND